MPHSWNDRIAEPGKPLWWEGVTLKASPVDRLPKSVDLCIIGAGLTGLSVGLHMARAGRSVLIIEAGSIGQGCSSRNGGMIGPSFHKLGVKGLTAAYGVERAHAMLAEGMKGLEFARSFIETEGIDCDLRVAGRFRGAFTAEDYDKLAREAETLSKSVGLSFEMVPRAHQSAEIGSDFYRGGVVYHHDGSLHPAKLVAGLAARAETAGVQISEATRLLGYSEDLDGFEVETSRGKLRCKQLFAATNGYTDKALQDFRQRVLPLRSAIFATEELPDDVAQSLSPKYRVLGDTRRLVFYYRRSHDGKRLVFGGRTLNQADRPREHAGNLHSFAEEIFPQIKGYAVTHSWSGTVAYTFDHAPHLGQLKGVHYAMGYCGSGVTRALYLGRKMALKMQGKDKEGQTAFDNLPFEGRPLYRGTPWFMPVIIRYHDILSKLRR